MCTRNKVRHTHTHTVHIVRCSLLPVFVYIVHVHETHKMPFLRNYVLLVTECDHGFCVKLLYNDIDSNTGAVLVWCVLLWGHEIAKHRHSERREMLKAHSHSPSHMCCACFCLPFFRLFNVVSVCLFRPVLNVCYYKRRPPLSERERVDFVGVEKYPLKCQSKCGVSR